MVLSHIVNKTVLNVMKSGTHLPIVEDVFDPAAVNIKIQLPRHTHAPCQGRPVLCDPL